MRLSYIEVAWELSRVSRSIFVPQKCTLWILTSQNTMCGSVCTQVDPFSANKGSR